VTRCRCKACVDKDAVKEAAWKLTHKAIAGGLLTRGPCEECGKTPAEGHHDDYEKPLSVRWLCRLHHKGHHAAQRRAKAAAAS